MKKVLLISLKEHIINNAQAANSGFKKIKAVIIWLADVDINFVSDVELNMEIVHVMKLTPFMEMEAKMMLKLMKLKLQIFVFTRKNNDIQNEYLLDKKKYFFTKLLEILFWEIS